MRAKQIPLVSGIKKTVRVATNNNFNCTVKEFRQLDGLAIAHPDSSFFINSNINTPELLRVNDHSYKVVVTVNPTLLVRSECVEKLYQIRKDLVAFVRVKYIPDHPEIQDLITRLAKDNYAVVITVQRWNGKKSLVKWTRPEYYIHSDSRYRLAGDALRSLQKFTDGFKDEKVFLCDRVGVGCQGCKLCVMLTSGEPSKLASVNLSSSGLCQFNCPDCYAKTMINMVTKFGYTPILYDRIRANYKQAGVTQHIKHTLQETRS